MTARQITRWFKPFENSIKDASFVCLYKRKPATCWHIYRFEVMTLLELLERYSYLKKCEFKQKQKKCAFCFSLFNQCGIVGTCVLRQDKSSLFQRENPSSSPG